VPLLVFCFVWMGDIFAQLAKSCAIIT